MNYSYRIPIPAVDFAPPVYTCKRTTKPFVLDGDIEKDFWDDAPYTEYFLDIEGSHMPTPRYTTRAKMLWDDQNLYIAARLDGPEIWATLTERDCVIFYDNDFEIFIDPDSDTQQYIEFEMNANNTVWDLLLTKAYRDKGKAVNGFDLHGMQSAVYINGKLNDPSADNLYWSVEIVIPFSSLYECGEHNRIPKNDEYYRINFSRVQWKVDNIDSGYTKQINPVTGKPYPEDNWVWAPTGVINIHYPELWAFVFFSDESNKDENYKVPEDELIKWELRKLYYAEQAYWDETGHFTNSLARLAEVLHRLSPTTCNKTVKSLTYVIETTSHSFEIYCPNHDNTGNITIFSDGKIECILH